jgi:biopolymer transport protein ExbD
MSKFKKVDERSAPAMNTASLPDIVFMLLFFFMVATTTKETDPTVKYMAPSGSETEDLTPYKQRSEIDFLYLGKPRNPNRASAFEYGFALSLDNVVRAKADGLYTTNKVGEWKMDKFSSKPSRMKKPIEGVITCIKADKEAPVGLLFEIRKQLQEVDALKIAYSVKDVGVMKD